MGARLQRLLDVLQPQLLLSLLLLLFSLVALFAALRRPPVVGVEVALGNAEDPKRRERVGLTVFEAGLEREIEVELPVASTRPERLLDILSGLRARSNWPESLALPTVFEVREQGQTIVVLDFAATNATLSVSDEWALRRSIEATLAAQGAHSLRFLKEGRADPVFLEHVLAP